jgi:hypothetical protein
MPGLLARARFQLRSLFSTSKAAFGGARQVTCAVVRGTFGHNTTLNMSLTRIASHTFFTAFSSFGC